MRPCKICGQFMNMILAAKTPSNFCFPDIVCKFGPFYYDTIIECQMFLSICKHIHIEIGISCH